MEWNIVDIKLNGGEHPTVTVGEGKFDFNGAACDLINDNGGYRFAQLLTMVEGADTSVAVRFLNEPADGAVPIRRKGQDGGEIKGITVDDNGIVSDALIAASHCEAPARYNVELLDDNTLVIAGLCSWNIVRLGPNDGVYPQVSVSRGRFDFNGAACELINDKGNYRFAQVFTTREHKKTSVVFKFLERPADGAIPICRDEQNGGISVSDNGVVSDTLFDDTSYEGPVKYSVKKLNSETDTLVIDD